MPTWNPVVNGIAGGNYMKRGIIWSLSQSDMLYIYKTCLKDFALFKPGIVLLNSTMACGPITAHS